MTKLLITLFHNWNIIPCKCGCKETRVTDQVLLDTYGPVCEYSLRCVKCNCIVNYWAYGYHQFPLTRTEQFARWYFDKKIYWNGFIQGLIQGFKNDIRNHR